jgi:hypothetical protein
MVVPRCGGASLRMVAERPEPQQNVFMIKSARALA